ncbi:2110_t:CDS:2 [Diversispora eburnea]|uniref:2110_t:CDS:1 n=1 Tax=Diversispora eburnea TaxID=1213867 RepID=A0A9N9AYV8_9GLOM|nr:2110_t:CDS:2 [Diversispora eburnea]
MTCLAYYDNSSANGSNDFHATIQRNVNINEEGEKGKNSATSSCYKPLPLELTNFIAESMCGILMTYQTPQTINWPLPELVFFVEKVTTRAKIDYHTAIVALILVSRLKKKLPKNAFGEYTYHRLFLSAILVASKDLAPEISGIYSVQDVNQMEKSFRKILGLQIEVYDDDVRNFVEKNKNALGIC